MSMAAGTHRATGEPRHNAAVAGQIAGGGTVVIMSADVFDNPELSGEPLLSLATVATRSSAWTLRRASIRQPEHPRTVRPRRGLDPSLTTARIQATELQ